MGLKKALKKAILKLREQEKRRRDLDKKASARGGLIGVLETTIRRYKTLSHAIATLPLYALGVVAMGLALTPAAGLFSWAMDWSAYKPFWHKAAAGAFAVAAGYFVYGFALVVILPVMNWMLRGNLKPFRGPYYSLGSLRWYIHNCLTYLARYTFLEFITPTPFNVMFYRAMGMKIGVDVQLNTTHISDPSLIEIGDRATIGGSATIIAHYASGGFLIIAPTKIGKGATIGLKATIMGGVEIGEYALVQPNSVVLPKTIIPAGEVWGGVPAQRIEQRRRAAA